MGRHDRQEGGNKKLTDAARRWAGGGGGRDEAAEDLAAFGVPEEDIEAWQERETEARNFEVWPENWPAVECFLALSTQWRHAGATGIPTGLDYAAIPAVARLLGHRRGRDLFEKLRIMEAEALDVLARRRG